MITFGQWRCQCASAGSSPSAYTASIFIVSSPFSLRRSATVSAEADVSCESAAEKPTAKLTVRVAGEPVTAHLRWYGGMFIPLILVLRHYAKGRDHLRVTKTLIVIFFVTFIAFISYMLKARIIVFQ